MGADLAIIGGEVSGGGSGAAPVEAQHLSPSLLRHPSLPGCSGTRTCAGGGACSSARTCSRRGAIGRPGSRGRGVYVTPLVPQIGRRQRHRLATIRAPGSAARIRKQDVVAAADAKGTRAGTGRRRGTCAGPAAPGSGR